MKTPNILTGDISKEDLSETINKVEVNSELIDSIVDDIVSKYCKSLDSYVKQIDDILKEGNEISDYELDDFALNLPSLIYFACDAQESLGIKEDVSKAFRAEIYNIAREKASGTVADKDSVAILASQKESLVVAIYQRSYKKIKCRIEAAYELLNSVKKVLTRRIASYGITESDKM